MLFDRLLDHLLVRIPVPQLLAITLAGFGMQSLAAFHPLGLIAIADFRRSGPGALLSNGLGAGAAPI